MGTIKECDFNAKRRFARLRVALGLDQKPDASSPRQASAEAIQPDKLEPASPALSRTRGRRALFVGNRADEELRLSLLKRFEFASLDWVAASNGRLRGAASAISSGRYDLVMVATGFISHAEEEKIADACAGGDVPYLRVEKGRPVTVERYALTHLRPPSSSIDGGAMGG